MRKFQELYLRDVAIDQRFWVDGAQYKRINRTHAPDKDNRVAAVLESEFYASFSEIEEGMPLLQPDDKVIYRADLIVLVEVSVPDGWKLVRNSGSIILKCEGQWSAGFSQYDSSTLSRNLWRLFDAMLAAAPAAPAADAGLVEAMIDEVASLQPAT